MDEDTIVLGIIGLVAVYWLVNRSSGSGGGGTNIPLPTTQGLPPPAVPAVVNTPSLGEPVGPGIYINPPSAVPRLGSAQNDATLAELLRMIESANAAGNWALSWQLAAKRDAWIKSQGY